MRKISDEKLKELLDMLLAGIPMWRIAHRLKITRTTIYAYKYKKWPIFFWKNRRAR